MRVCDYFYSAPIILRNRVHYVGQIIGESRLKQSGKYLQNPPFRHASGLRQLMGSCAGGCGSPPLHQQSTEVSRMGPITLKPGAEDVKPADASPSEGVLRVFNRLLQPRQLQTDTAAASVAHCISTDPTIPLTVGARPTCKVLLLPLSAAV